MSRLMDPVGLCKDLFQRAKPRLSKLSRWSFHEVVGAASVRNQVPIVDG
jgi:hypothetical protein